jgi:hypothetical protein
VQVPIVVVVLELVVVVSLVLVLVLLDVVVEEVLVVVLGLEELVVEDEVSVEVVLDDVVVVGSVEELVEVEEEVVDAMVVEVVTDVVEELVVEEEELARVVVVVAVVVVVDGACSEQVHWSLHPAPSGHTSPSHCSPLPSSTMPSPQRVSCATNFSLTFDFFTTSVPLRLVQVVSSFPVSFTLPVSPVHDRHTAMTVVPCLVAFSFACTGLQALPIETSFPITTGSTGVLESPVTSALPVTM